MGGGGSGRRRPWLCLCYSFFSFSVLLTPLIESSPCMAKSWLGGDWIQSLFRSTSVQTYLAVAILVNGWTSMHLLQYKSDILCLLSSVLAICKTKHYQIISKFSHGGPQYFLCREESSFSHHRSSSSVSSLFIIRSDGSRPSLEAVVLLFCRSGILISPYLEASSSHIPLTVTRPSLTKPLPMKVTTVIILFSEHYRFRFQISAASASVLYLKRPRFFNCKPGSPVILFVNPVKLNFNSSLRLVIFSSQAKQSLTYLVMNPQLLLTPITITYNVDLQEFESNSGRAYFSNLGQHWYEMGFLGFLLCCGSVFGFKILKELGTILGSIIRLILLLAGIYYGLYYLVGWLAFDWLVIGLDKIAGLVFQSVSDSVFHLSKPKLIFVVIASHFYKATSLSDVVQSRLRESTIFSLLMQSVVIPEQFSNVRRFTTLLEKAILFQTVQRRATDLDSLRLPPVFDSLECLEHLSHRESWNIVHDISFLSSLSEALSFILCIYPLLASVSPYLVCFIVTETICIT